MSDKGTTMQPTPDGMFPCRRWPITEDSERRMEAWRLETERQLRLLAEQWGLA